MKTNHKQAQSNNQKKKIKTNLQSYARYSGLSIQMIIVVLAGAFGGIQLDKWVKWKFPCFTLIFSLLGVFLAIYLAIKDFLKK